MINAKKRSLVAVQGKSLLILVVIVEATPFHLHHCPGKQKDTTLWVIMILPRGAQHKAFCQTKEANDLHLLLQTEVLPSKITRKLDESVGAVGNKGTVWKC